MAKTTVQKWLLKWNNALATVLTFRKSTGPELATEISLNLLFRYGDVSAMCLGSIGLIVMCGHADVLMETSSKQLSHYRKGRDNQSCLQNL